MIKCKKITIGFISFYGSFPIWTSLLRKKGERYSVGKKEKNEVLQINRIANPKCNNSKEVCPLIDGLEGANNRKFNFGFQIIYSIITLSILGNNNIEGNNFFIQLTLFSTPLLLEYSNYKSKNKINNNIYKFQKVIFAIATVIGLVGTFGDALRISIINNTTYIEVSKDFFILKGSRFNIIWIIAALGIAILGIFIHIYSLENKFEGRLSVELTAS